MWPRVEDRVQLRIVIHLHLPVKTEAAFASNNLGPELVETKGEIGALLLKHGEAIEVAQMMLV